MGKFHIFDVEVAQQFGIVEAILLYNISHWIEKNKANGKHFHDGEYWTYNSRDAFLKLFPYMSDWQVRAALKNLVDNNILLIGNYNKMPYDRTKWYALTESGKAICENHNFDWRNFDIPLEEFNQSIGEIHQPIPDNIPNNKTDKNTDIVIGADKPQHQPSTRFYVPAVEDIAAYCEERNNGIDAEKFFDYYERQGWRLSNNKPMKDWRAAIRTWERNERSRQSIAADEKKPKGRQAANETEGTY